MLFSGFNNLGLARQPHAYRGEHGAFFNCHQFFDALTPQQPTASNWSLSNLFGKPQEPEQPTPPSMQEQIDYAANLTLQHLDIWRALATDMGAKLTFILQPLAGWVRETGSHQEEQLFAELDQLGNFTEVYGDILQTSVREDYAQRLRDGARAMGWSLSTSRHCWPRHWARKTGSSSTASISPMPATTWFQNLFSMSPAKGLAHEIHQEVFPAPVWKKEEET